MSWIRVTASKPPILLRIPIRGYETRASARRNCAAVLRIPIRGYELEYYAHTAAFRHVTNPYKGL